MTVEGLQLDWLDAAARSFPRRIALRFENQTWTFLELLDAVDAAEAALAEFHHRNERRLGVLAANRPGTVLALHAARRLGEEIAFLNWRQTADELSWQIQDAGIDLVIADGERMDVARAAARDSGATVVPVESIEDAKSDLGPIEPRRIDLNRGALVLYTSGTTGRPKGARLTNRNLWHSAIASALHLGHMSNDVWLATLPHFHIGGLSILIRSAICGSTVVLEERFDPERTGAAIDGGVTLISLTPTMAERLLQHRPHGFQDHELRVVLLGGSASPFSLVEACLGKGLPVAPTYGLTKASSQVTTLLPDEVRPRPGSAGRPLPGVEIRVATETGIADSNQEGLIEIRGPTVFPGYLGVGSVDTNRAADGWWKTGDIGYLDTDGFLFVLDRRQDLIISGGENIYPAEVERVLLEHPQVADAGVIARADGQWGERPVAFVVWRGPGDGAEVELTRHCRAKLASFKVPTRFLFLSELPRSSSGKLLRRELRPLASDPT